MRMRPDTALSLRRVCERAYLSRLREKTPEDFAAVPDAAEGLHFRLYEAARRGSSPEEIADLAKSKRYAHARLRRMVMCAALGVRSGDANGIPPYIRVLAFDARGAGAAREMKTSAALPVVVKSARVKDENESIQRLFDLGSPCTRPLCSWLEKPRIAGRGRRLSRHALLFRREQPEFRAR